jgi:ABC-2 type transport system ATP-binding protein
MKVILSDVEIKGSQNNTILGPLNMTIERGLTGVVGLNGSGKSLLLKVLAQNIFNPQVSYSLNGIDIPSDEAREILGYVPQDIAIYEDMTVRSYLMYIAGLKCVGNSLAAVERVSRSFRLTSIMDVKLGICSVGRQRLAMIAQAFLNSPVYVFMDEPFVSLDIAQRRHVEEFLIDYSLRAVIVVFSHIVEEMQAYDRIIRMSDGKVDEIKELLDTGIISANHG